MNSRNAIVTIVIIWVASVAWQGCSGVQEASYASNYTEGLDKLTLNENALGYDNGGFVLDDGLPSFGDLQFQSAFEESKRPDAGLDALINLDRDVTDAERTEPIYYVRLLWGKPRYQSNYATKVDFSGSVTVSGGAIKVLRVVRFENQDAEYDRVLPRDSRYVVKFKSMIHGHHDGLILKVIALPGMSGGRFTFATKAYTVSMPLSDLSGINTLYQVDDDGNRVSLTAFKYAPATDCPTGFLRGVWKRTSEAGGVFGGAWVSRTGRLIGHLRGIWGERRDGTRVFFGRYLAKNGLYRGLLKGTYVARAGTEGGTFVGYFFDRKLRVRGVLRGHYVSPTVAAVGGFFHGGWQRICHTPCRTSYLEVPVDPSSCSEEGLEPEDACDADDSQIDTTCQAIEPRSVDGFCCSSGVVTQLSKLSSACPGTQSGDATELALQCRPLSVDPFGTPQ